MNRHPAKSLLGVATLATGMALMLSLSAHSITPDPQSTPASAPASTSAPGRQVIFFDSTQYGPVTVRSRLGLPSCQSTNGSIGGKTDKSTVQWHALRWARDGVDAIALDIEEFSFNLQAPEECKRNAEACAERLRWAKEAAPSVKIGLFGYPFSYPYYQVVNLEAGAKGHQAFRDLGDLVKPIIGPAIDFSCPEVYTRDLLDKEHDPTGGVLHAQRLWIIASVAECRRLFPDKPVYPFLSPAYVIGGGAKDHIGEYIPGDAFASILESCKFYADGAIVWGGWGPKGRLPWNPNEPWAKALKAVAGK